MTGATGLVGKATLAQAIARGHSVAALARRPQADQPGVRWIAGDLANNPALDMLVADADAVVHIAGAVNARDRAGFEAANADGTANVIASMGRQGVRRLVHVSSLAAREPQLSDYGWSKTEAEAHVKASGLDWTMVRPPAIYGGADKDMLELFVMASRGVMLLPPPGRMSVIAVDNLAALLIVLAGQQEAGIGAIYEVSDAQPADGWTHREFAQAVGRAVGRDKVRTIALPAAALRLGARIDRLLRGDDARLTPDRAGYICHPDWVSRSDMAPPAELWTPHIATDAGLAATAAAYRAKGSL